MRREGAVTPFYHTTSTTEDTTRNTTPAAMTATALSTGVVCILAAEVCLSRYLFLRRMERAVAVIAAGVVFLVVSSVVLVV